MEPKGDVRRRRHPRRVPLSVRIMPSIRAALEQAAEAEMRTVGALVEIAVEEWLRTKGHL